MAVPKILTRILKEPWEVDPELARLNLTRAKLLKVRTMALGAAADATGYHAANAAGTFSYHGGIYGLRDELVGEHWRQDRPNGIEAVRNDAKNVILSFVNVDLACNDMHNPVPRSKKGSGAEKVSQGKGLFDDLPAFAEAPTSPYAFYYLMVDEQGAVELSRPVVKYQTFSAFIDRIYLSSGDDFDGASRSFDEDETPMDFDPQVLRKAS
nr:hypothetical protein [uncultured Rhodopila sp.]